MNDDRLAMIEVFAEQAELLQKHAAAMQAQAQADSAATKTQIGVLLKELADVNTSLKLRHRDLAGAFAGFTKSVDQIAPRAFEGGKEAVTTQARAAFKEAGAALAAANEEAIAPTRAALAKGLAAQDASRAMLETAAQRLSGKALALVSGVTIAALLTMAAGGYGFVMWQRGVLESARQEASSLELKIANLQTIVADLEKKGAALDAKGVRFETTVCGAEGKNKGRLCVAIDPVAPLYGSSTRPYRVPLGY